MKSYLRSTSTYNAAIKDTSASSLRKNVRCTACKLEYPTILGSMQLTDFIGIFIEHVNN